MWYIKRETSKTCTGRPQPTKEIERRGRTDRTHNSSNFVMLAKMPASMWCSRPESMLLQAQVAEREREARRGARMARKKERKTKKSHWWLGGCAALAPCLSTYRRWSVLSVAKAPYSNCVSGFSPRRLQKMQRKVHHCKKPPTRQRCAEPHWSRSVSQRPVHLQRGEKDEF